MAVRMSRGRIISVWKRPCPQDIFPRHDFLPDAASARPRPRGRGTGSRRLQSPACGSSRNTAFPAFRTTPRNAERRKRGQRAVMVDHANAPTFSDEFRLSRNALKNATFSKDWGKLIKYINVLLGETGPNASHAPALSDHRRRLEKPSRKKDRKSKRPTPRP